MSLLRRYWGITKKTILSLEDRVDQWVVKNPLALLSHIRFKLNQKRMYDPRSRRTALLRKSENI